MIVEVGIGRRKDLRLSKCVFDVLYSMHVNVKSSSEVRIGVIPDQVETLRKAPIGKGALRPASVVTRGLDISMAGQKK